MGDGMGGSGGGAAVSAWARVPFGWALNLDGSNAALGFSLPRLEIRSTGAGWRSECLTLDGRRLACGGEYLGGVAAAMATALAQAEQLLGPAHATALRAARRPA
jgi:hypothetical protein